VSAVTRLRWAGRLTTKQGLLWISRASRGEYGSLWAEGDGKRVIHHEDHADVSKDWLRSLSISIDSSDDVGGGLGLY
jgi:hypothetical protein